GTTLDEAVTGPQGNRHTRREISMGENKDNQNNVHVGENSSLD
ncbi:hypothetical protein TNIN_384821, partial [Trichonephila inaurata madagascariensis]